MKSFSAQIVRTFLIFVLAFAAASALNAQQAAAPARWTEAQANAWYAQQPWPVGADFLPSTAINELEMWQADTFDPVTIDRELGWAEAIGMNTMRVFLHNLLWEQDPKGFSQRIDQFLAICARHHIRPVFVLFDSCWDPQPQARPPAPARRRRPQLRLGPGPRHRCPQRPRAISPSRKLHPRHHRSLRQ